MQGSGARSQETAVDLPLPGPRAERRTSRPPARGEGGTQNIEALSLGERVSRSGAFISRSVTGEGSFTS